MQKLCGDFPQHDWIELKTWWASFFGRTHICKRCGAEKG